MTIGEPDFPFQPKDERDSRREGIGTLRRGTHQGAGGVRAPAGLSGDDEETTRGVERGWARLKVPCRRRLSSSHVTYWVCDFSFRRPQDGRAENYCSHLGRSRRKRPQRTSGESTRYWFAVHGVEGVRGLKPSVHPGARQANYERCRPERLLDHTDSYLKGRRDPGVGASTPTPPAPRRPPSNFCVFVSVESHPTNFLPRQFYGWGRNLCFLSTTRVEDRDFISPAPDLPLSTPPWTTSYVGVRSTAERKGATRLSYVFVLVNPSANGFRRVLQYLLNRNGESSTDVTVLPSDQNR